MIRSSMRAARTSGLLLLLVLAVSMSAGAQAPSPMGSTSGAPSPSTTIVPGYAIGPWTLDTSWTDLVWMLQARAVRLSSPGPQFRPEVEVDTWRSPSVTAVRGPSDNTVQALGIGASDYVTRERIGVGATEEQITAAYRAPSAVVQFPSRPKVLVYNALGLAFQVSFDPAAGSYGPVERVFVFRPGRAARIWRVP